jgi:hypothetical protein
MAADDRRRHLLYRTLEDVLDPDEAGILMDHLPPVGWADVARRSDLEVLRGPIDGLRREISSMEQRLSDRFDAKLESKVNSQTETLVGLMTGQVVAVAGLAFAFARLT